MGPRSDVGENNIEKRAVCVWVLDFNQCADISMDENGCIKAAEAFWDNDPYYPRPGCLDPYSSEILKSIESSTDEATATTPSTVTDEELWNFFKEKYLEFSGRIMEEAGAEEWQSLPEIFVQKVVEMGKSRLYIGSLSMNPGPPKGGSARREKHQNRKSRGIASRRKAEEIILEESSI
jgi:hypothetical protein